MRSLGEAPGDEAERDAIERGEVIQKSEAGWLVRYQRGGEERWALLDGAGRVVLGTEDEVRRLA